MRIWIHIAEPDHPDTPAAVDALVDAAGRTIHEPRPVTDPTGPWGEAHPGDVAIQLATRPPDALQECDTPPTQSQECDIPAIRWGESTGELPTVTADPALAVHDAAELVAQAVSIAEPDEPAPAPPPRRIPRRRSGGIRDALLVGVGAVIPLVTAAGLLTTLGYALGGHQVAQAASVVTGGVSFVPTTWGPLAYQLGALGFALLVPALAAFVAMAMADRQAFVPGLVGGAAATAAGAGYLGGLAAGLLAAGLTRLCSGGLPRSRLSTAMALVGVPLLATLGTGAVMLLVVGPPLAAVTTGLAHAVAGLTDLTGMGVLLFGALVGVLVSVDMGGPINKAVYTFAVAGLLDGSAFAPRLMAAVMAAGMVPPLAMALATQLRRTLFTPEERAAGRAAWVLGGAFITEGAIPFAVLDPLRVIPSVAVGSATAGALAAMLDTSVAAPHGGLFALPLIGNPLGFLLAVACGMALAAGLVVVAKSRHHAERLRRADSAVAEVGS